MKQKNDQVSIVQKDIPKKDNRMGLTLTAATTIMPKLVVHLVSQHKVGVTIPLSGKAIPADSVQVYDLDGVSSSAESSSSHV